MDHPAAKIEGIVACAELSTRVQFREIGDVCQEVDIDRCVVGETFVNVHVVELDGLSRDELHSSEWAADGSSSSDLDKLTFLHNGSINSRCHKYAEEKREQEMHRVLMFTGVICRVDTVLP